MIECDKCWRGETFVSILYFMLIIFVCTLGNLIHTTYYRACKLMCMVCWNYFENYNLLRESCRTRVNLEFLYGTCALFFQRALITSPRALRLLLIFRASLRRSPCICDDETHSEPARSTKFNLPTK